MKKIFTLLCIAFASTSIAQIDLAVRTIDQPFDYIQDGQTQTKFLLQFTLQNKGRELMAADTIIWTWGIINQDPVQYLVQGTPIAFILPQNLPNGGIYQTNPYEITINGTINTTTPVYVLVEAYVFNRSTPAVDIDSTNNGKLWGIKWASVSTRDIVYNSDNIAIYPNPANEQLNVELLFAESNAVTLELFDLTGKSVGSSNSTQAITPNHFTIDVANLNRGVYILKVTNGNKVTTSKVTISH